MHFLKLQRLVLLLKSRSPWVFLGSVGISIFTAEVLVMFFFMTLPKLPDIAEAFLDGMLLSILVAPALYYFLYKPLRVENQERQLIEQELRRSEQQLQRQAEQLQDYSQALELKVVERTQELTDKNIQLQELLEQLHSTQIQMVQSEKMSSLGQLVAGVAHEINNPVNFIHGNLNYLQEYIHNLLSFVRLYQKYYPAPVSEIEREAKSMDLEFLQQDLPKLLSSMQMGTDRIREIVVSLRNFSRLDESDFKTVNIHEGIDSTLLILQHRLKARPKHPEITVVHEYGNLPLVECYPGQINQVLMNILANAIDALEAANPYQAHPGSEDYPSHIKIRTSVIDSPLTHSPTAHSPTTHSPTTHLQWIQIAIADNGSGMSEAIQQQIFNPFFTTKSIGQGTGMGLAISYQIITEKHSGKLECFSMVGEGTEFIIQIPIKQRV